jgi:hypothetical protein
MKIKSLIKHNLMRAAMTLALILACATAWAVTENVSSDNFTDNGDGTYTIHNAAGWGEFCDALQNNTYNHFSDKTVKLDADITVTQMAGGSNHAFTGTFDGNHKTLTLNYGTVQAPIDAEFVAPFVEVSGGAEFINLNIDGHIYAAYTGSSDPGVGGLIGHLFGGITIEGCTSTVEVNSTKDRVGGFVGLCEHAVTFTNCKSSAVVTCTGSGSGFVGWSRDSNHTIAFYGCLFNGKVLKKNGVGSGNGGFIGWKGDSKNVTITNCLVDPAPLGEGETMANGNSATFSREHSDHAATITNCYYTDTLGTAQGTKVYSISKGQYVTTLEINGTATQSYTVSGLSFYSTGIKYGDVLYAAENDVVSLTLSNSSGGDVPAGYQYVYSTNAGTLEGSTLTMPDADVIVSAALRSTGQPVSITYIDADGTIGSHDAIALDGTETMLGEYYKDTWYFVGIDINVNHQVQVYKVHLILCNGKSMNFGTSSSPVNFKCIYYAYSDSAITIYGQTLIDDDAGNLNIYSYHTGFDLPNNYTQNSGNVTISSTYNYDYGINSSAVTLNGGKLIVTSIRASSSSIYINGGKIQATSQLKAASNIKLGWTNPDDYIQVSQYNAIYGNVIVAAGKCFAYTASGETTILGGDNETTLTTDQIAAIAGKRLYPTVPYLGENGETQQCTEFTLLTGTETTLGAAGQETWCVVQGTLNYTHGIQLLGNTHIILCDGAAMNIGSSGSPVSGKGLYSGNPGDYNLSIYAQSGNTGALNIYSEGNSYVGGSLTLAGGNVNATGDYCEVRGDATFNNVTASFTSPSSSSIICHNHVIVHNSSLEVQANGQAIFANGGDVTLSNVTANITSSTSVGIECANFAVDNSQLTVTALYQAIYANNGNGVITLGCTAATDFIQATCTASPTASYSGTVKIADGQKLYAGANEYTGTLNDAERQAIGGQKLTNVAPPTYDYIDLDGTGATHTAVVIDADNMPTALSGWYIVQGTVSYTNTIDLAGDTHIILADNAVMNVTVTGYNNGIQSTSGNKYSLFVYGQTGQSGELNVTSDRFACYIIYGGDITIAGGKVTASGTTGIYAQYYNNKGGNVTIKNATVTATGTSFGILSENGGNITIDNSNVTATGNYGIYAQNGDITIASGTVTASGTQFGIYTDGSVTINGGQVTATGNYGIYTINGSVTINGGQVTATGNYGIYTINGSVTINGGQVSAIGNTYGILAQNSSDHIILGWTNPTDYIYANKYDTYGTLSIADGKAFIDEDGQTYSGTVAKVSGAYAINGKTLYPYSENAVPYLNENGQQRYCVAYTTLTGTETSLGTAGQETWYVVDSDVSFTDLTINGDIHLILVDGKTMNLNHEQGFITLWGQANLTIYGQTNGTGTLSSLGLISTMNITVNGGIVNVKGDGFFKGENFIPAIWCVGDMVINGGKVYAQGDMGIVVASMGAKSDDMTTYNFTLNGGQVTAIGMSTDMGIIATGNITLGWTNPTDYIYANKYYAGGTLSIASSKTFVDENNTPYSGTIAQVDEAYAIDGKTLYPNCVVRKQVTGYGVGNGGWVFIASPVAGSIAPSEVHNLFPSAGETSNDYDLYRFDQSSTNGKEWQNWKQDEGHNNVAPGFSLVNGHGYLYATKETRTLVFAGEYTAATAPVEVPLDYDENAQLKGWNLVGNPFTVSATSSQPYYRMNAEGTALKTETETTAVAAMEGVFVQATGNNPQVTFTAQTRGGEQATIVQANIMVGGDNGAVIDNAIIRFDGGQTLEKFSFREGSTKLYIPQDGKDYAIATSNGQGEMPLNFKAKENGTYTISVNPEGVEMNYLHLIDNMTGTDIDLLAANGGDAKHCVSYTFTAKTTDYESRFRLVFVANGEDGSATGSEAFAFFSNGNWIIANDGQATLQVIDINGRILSSESISGSVSKAIDATAGVYMIRLINGENVKTQKIVVK